MRYANLLWNAISDSGYTYSQIAMKCESKGVKLSRGYLSLLATGKKPPASDEINKALCDVLKPVAEISFEELTFAKYKETLSPEVMSIIFKQEAKKCGLLKTS